jgi:hypothetical protein
MIESRPRVLIVDDDAAIGHVVTYYRSYTLGVRA